MSNSGHPSVSVVYPYIHLSSQKETLIKANHLSKRQVEDMEWVEQGIYCQVDQVSVQESFAIPNIEFMIFIGAHIDDDTLPSRVGT